MTGSRLGSILVILIGLYMAGACRFLFRDAPARPKEKRIRAMRLRLYRVDGEYRLRRYPTGFV
jgi:hypothetical protein